MNNNYRKTDTTIYCCRYHIIFCPKYRRKIFREEIANRFKEIVKAMEKEQNFYVIEMEVMPDHIHLLLDVDPIVGVNTLIARIKGKTANLLCKEFPEIRRRIPTLWSRSKFIATVGDVSSDAVEEYIKSQKTNEQRRKK